MKKFVFIAVQFCLIMAAQAQTANHYWSFDGHLNDSAGNLSGTQVGLVETVPSVVDSGLRFDGYGHVNLGNALDFESNQPFSLSLWFRPDSVDTIQALIGKRQVTAPGSGWQILLVNGTVTFRLVHNDWDSPSNELMVMSNQAITDTGRFSHLTVTYDGSGSANGVAMYLDGAQIGTSNIFDTLTQSIQHSSPASLGANSNGSVPVLGTVDELRVFHSVLDEAAVSCLYNQDPLCVGDAAGLTLLSETGQQHRVLPPAGQTGTWNVVTDGTTATWSLDTDTDNRATFSPLAAGVFFLDFNADNQSLSRLRIEVPQPPDNGGDVFAEDVVLFLDFEGDDGSQNFVDLSPVGQIVNAENNAIISHDNPHQGQGSLKLDTHSWLQIPVNDSLVFGAEDVTVDFWVFPKSVRRREDFFSFDVGSNGDYVSVLYNYNVESRLAVWDNQGNAGAFTVDLQNSWHHIAYVRRGGTGYLYVDGVLRYQNVHMRDVLEGRSDFYIGGWAPDIDNSHTATGFMDNFRVTRAARYTENFDPNNQ